MRVVKFRAREGYRYVCLGCGEEWVQGRAVESYSKNKKPYDGLCWGCRQILVRRDVVEDLEKRTTERFIRLEWDHNPEYTTARDVEGALKRLFPQSVKDLRCYAIPVESTDALAFLLRVISDYASTKYNDGIRRGKNFVKGLADGTISIDEIKD